MKQHATRDLFDYWNGLRGERAAPERGDIDPLAIRSLLADTFLLDLDAPCRFTVRLAGTRVNGLFDAEQKGKPFLDLWRPEERRNVAAVLATVADGTCPVVVGAAGAPAGHEACGFELLFLPLRHFGRTHARMLGLITATSQPLWLGLLPPSPLSLRSLRILDVPEPVVERAGDDEWSDGIGGFVGDAGRPLPDDAVSRPAVPHLRLIRGGRVDA